MIDTDVAIHARDLNGDVLDRLALLDRPPSLSVISRIELEGGVYRDAAQQSIRRARLDILLADVDVLPFEEGDVIAYRHIVAALGFSRRQVSDRMIAAQALRHAATLITMNGVDFRGIPGLRLEVWDSPLA